ncbi:hypothetical protein [Ramlibacter sp. PS4R-6]|uniref:hypothetical protein n=1 Tax=Ramlibacter sp. PS4R-6 TaxID=3133438 RepID=UPI0030A367E7
MAQTYLFFRPSRLPLEPGELDAGAVLNMPDTPELRRQVEDAFPGLQWQSTLRGSAEAGGNWYEVHLPEGAEATLSIRCSLKADHSAFVQDLCDRFRWLAFDERPMCFQPHRAPFPA